MQWNDPLNLQLEVSERPNSTPITSAMPAEERSLSIYYMRVDDWMTFRWAIKNSPITFWPTGNQVHFVRGAFHSKKSRTTLAKILLFSRKIHYLIVPVKGNRHG